jgi:uncharacterized protein YjiS (DUF1127 family)
MMMTLHFHVWSHQLQHRIMRLARRLAAVGRRRTAILTLQRLDDRTLADIGVSRGEIEFAVRSGAPACNPGPVPAASRAETYALAGRRAA